MSRDLLILGFQTAQMTITANLAGLTQEESLQPPADAGNCINWLAGHLATTRDGMKQLLGLEFSGGFSEDEARPYQQGSGPLRDAKAALPLERIMQVLASTHSELLAKLQSTPDSTFDAALDPAMIPIPVAQPTTASLLMVFVFHEAYHSGQIGLGRRLVGKGSGMGF